MKIYISKLEYIKNKEVKYTKEIMRTKDKKEAQKALRDALENAHSELCDTISGKVEEIEELI